MKLPHIHRWHMFAWRDENGTDIHWMWICRCGKVK